jgi:uncharacterized protein (TIGR00290 family)
MNDWISKVQNKQFIASFSGGKDSMLALYKAMQVGKPIGLIAMLDATDHYSYSHRLSPEFLEAQAHSLGLPIWTRAATWTTYEKQFMELLEEAKANGAEVLVTGDVDVPEHGFWHANVTTKAGIGLCMPNWQKEHRTMVEEFVELGFVAIVTTVNLSLGMRLSDLGRILTRDYIKELVERSIDPCGEAGEFHTTVIDGPIFSTPLQVEKLEIIQKDEYAFLPLKIK